MCRGCSLAELALMAVTVSHGCAAVVGGGGRNSSLLLGGKVVKMV